VHHGLVEQRLAEHRRGRDGVRGSSRAVSHGLPGACHVAHRGLDQSPQAPRARAKLWLVPIELACASGLTPAELRRVRELTRAHAAAFVERWHEVFGR